MHWMEPSVAIRKQDIDTLKTIGFPSTVPSVAFFQSTDMTDIGHAHSACAQNPSQHLTAPCAAPPCASHDQLYPVAPFSQPISFDGSLNDVLLPFQYDKHLHDIMPSEQDEPLVQQLAPTAQIQQSQLYYTDIPFSNSERKWNIPLSNALNATNDIELACAIGKSHQDVKNVMMVSSLPPIAPTPALTRRPPMRKGTVSYRENHIHTERQRRQDMTSLFNRLKSVLPNVQHDDLKGDRCTILEHIINYVQELDKKVKALGKMKLELMHGKEETLCHHRCCLIQEATISCADSISVRPWGQVDIFITLNCPKHRGLWPSLLALLQETLQLDIQNVDLSSTPNFLVHSIYAKIRGNDSEEVCCKVENTLRDFVTDHAHNNHLKC